MASHTSSSTDEEDLALALRLLQLSSDAFDEHISHLYHTRSAPPSPVPSLNTLEQYNLALASGVSQRSPNAAEEAVSQLPSDGSSLASNDANRATSQFEDIEDNLELVFMLSELPADIFDEQAGELSRRRVPSMTDLDNPARATTEVWMALSLRNLDH